MADVMDGYMNDPKNSGDTDSNVKDNANPYYSKEYLEYLRSIDDSLRQLLREGRHTSAANARNSMPNRSDFRSRQSSGDSWSDMRYAPGRNSRRRRSGYGSATSDFGEGIRESLMEALGASDFKKKVRGSLDEFADMMGVHLEDVPKTLGQAFGRSLINKFRSTDIGSRLLGDMTKAGDNAFSRIKDAFNQGVAKYNESHPNQPDVSFGNHNKAQDVRNVGAETVKGYTNQAVNNVEKETSRSEELKRQVAELSVENLTVYADNVLIDNKEKLPEVDKAQSNIEHPEESNSITDLSGELKDVAESSLGDNAKSIVAAESSSTDLIASNAPKTTEVGLSLIEGGEEAAEVASGAMELEAIIAGLGEAVTMIASKALPLLAAIVAVTIVMEALAPAIEGTKILFGELQRSGNRYNESRKKAVEEAKKRLSSDVETLIKTPFDIMQAAAQKMYDTWDANLQKINATQGYSKSDLQDLISNFAQRLRDEGLTKVISSADITTSLSSVLEAGLSGKVAEEFAYQATKLNAEIPTQDFLQYADTYASLAFWAIRAGKSQEEAIEYANKQLELFASDILYADRQLAGGFTTGLTNAKNLFEDAVKISQTAKSGNPSNIAGVLTSVAAITGAIAPDLTSSITDVIVKAATGGNSSEIVALRSLAGINASNTEFLRALADDPKKVFTTLFTNLANMQNMSNDNYMEVAEGLSGVFGVSMDAFARIDFNYLAKAISNMDVNNNALNENLALLRSGETTLTAEQLRNQQINEYMIEEGLALVLDNEAARAIQQHMWDEQIALQMQESTYAVELKGAALEFLEGIRETIYNISKILNPALWFAELGDMVSTIQEGYAQESDIRQVLELGKVGKGNPESMYQLTTRGQLLNITDDLVNMLGGVSAYGSVSDYRRLNRALGVIASDPTYILNELLGTGYSHLSSRSSANYNDINSKYKWGDLGKSAASAYGSSYQSGDLVAKPPNNIVNVSQTIATSKLSKMLEDEYITKLVQEGKTYDDWAASASDFGIANLSEALEAAGYTESQVRSRFESIATQEGTRAVSDRYVDEQDFRDKGREFWVVEEEYTRQLVELINETNFRLDSIIDRLDNWLECWGTFRDYFNWHNFYESWSNSLGNDTNGWNNFFRSFTDYFILHKVYDAAIGTNYYSKVAEVQNKEKDNKDTAIQALAEILTKNQTDLKDPVVQTNALLAEILVQLLAIVQNTNETAGTLSFSDALASLSLGGT